MPDDVDSSPSVEVTIAWATLLKIGAAILLAFLAVRLWPFAELLLLALLVAVTLRPLLHWTERRGWPTWTGILLAVVLTFGSLLLLIGLLIPTVASQVTGLVTNLPKFKEHLLQMLPTAGPLRDGASQLLDSASFSNPEPLLKNVFYWGSSALGAIAEFLVVLVLAIYFLADGRRVYEWLLAFLPESHRQKVAVAAPEISSVVSSYMFGQLITSLLCAAFVFILLSVLHVPNAALLGVLAGVFDILPMVGFFLSMIPAAALALTVSPVTALIVVLVYGAYHLFEAYFIIPKVYGNRLRLSTLAVLVACLAAALVAGVIGAIVILPIVASYPVIERIWLRPLLERDTIAKHAEIEAREHPEA